jgi:DNA ligase (NAD+)
MEKKMIMNYKKRFDEMKLAKGEELIFELRNDVLGYVHKKDSNFYDPNNEIAFIKSCPICGTGLKYDDNYAYCDDKDCPGLRKGKIFNFLSKLGVEGVAEETVSRLYDARIITSITDLYLRKLDDINSLIVDLAEGFKQKAADVFTNAIATKLYNLKEGDLLGALNIPSISTTKANLICDHFNLLDIVNGKITEAEFTNINGLGKQTYIILMDSMTDENKEIIDTIWDIGYLSVAKTKGLTNSKDIKKVVFTGSVVGYKNRKEYETWLENNGYKLASGVSKDTYCLICNEKTSSSSKTNKAKQLGTPILTQEEFKIQESL